MSGIVQSDEEQAFCALSQAYHLALDIQYRSRRDLHAKTFRPRPDGPDRDRVPMSFSRTLIGIAGGIWGLLRDWEPE